MWSIVNAFPFEWLIAFLFFVILFANLKHNWFYFILFTAIASLVI